MTTASPRTLGFIGGGLNSAVGNAHFTAAQMDGLFRVAAGCFSAHADTNRQTAERWHIDPDRCYPNWQRLLECERGRLDAIVVLTPTPEHLEPVTAALRSGYAVICEKALAASSADARLMVQTAKDVQRPLFVTYNYSGYPMVRELKRLIQDGCFGSIQQIHAEMPQEVYVRLGADGQPVIPQNWRLRDSDIPTLSLDLGVHLHHLIDDLTGAKPLEVVATHSRFGRFREVIDNVVAMIHYSGNLEANLWYSKAAFGHRNGLRLRVYGDQGSAEWFQMEPEALHLHDHHGQPRRVDRASVEVKIAQQTRYNRFKVGHPAGFLEAFANLYGDISEALLIKELNQAATLNHPLTFSAQVAMEGLVMLEAVTESANKRKWVEIGLGYDQ
ncbi:Gfo/Idh/MocA family oxidoreductase [Lamprobacter modestohalophilus]|uniref:Gfo/Idh/MocA family protein n=1 Tax=Lamprobacter modestohalophilus TaxID=1064514 RepID=UPI002ADEC6DE|nr:Gfo/Idh/MocA family oxidoreductase [Lamprobacter modestohalophilus]MEA1053148.1 Gfo/Idh/MocA family oxidoreductase [Lamprobacter modestohalophilus]